MRPLTGLGIAIALVLISKFAVPFEAGFALQPAFNDYFIRFARGPSPLAPALLAIPAVAFLVVTVSAILGTHIYGAALFKTYYRYRSKLSISGKKIVLLSATYFLSSIIILLGSILVMKPAVQARFDAIYATIADQLWLPIATYRADMMNVSLQTTLAPCGALFCLLATGALLQWHITILSHKWRAALSAFCVITAGVVGYRWTQLAAWHPPNSWHVIRQLGG